MTHIEPSVPLDELDPGQGDPGYWTRFHGRVVDAAGSRLERRRSAMLTPGEVLLSWGQMLVPVAVAAAAIAALMLVSPHPEDEMASITGLEEVLADLGDGELPLPAFLYGDEVVDRDLVLFAVQDY